MSRNSASSTHGSPQCAIDHAQVAELAADVVEHRRTAELELRVDPRRAGLVDHHRDPQLLRRLIDRERQVGIVRRPVLVHRVELHARQAQLRHGAPELLDRRADAPVRRVHRREADEALGVGAHDRRHVVVAAIRVHRLAEPEGAGRVDGADQPAVEHLRRDREDDDLVEARVVAQRLGRPDHRPALAGVAARLPLVVGRHPVRRQQAHAPVDAERSLAAVLQRELRVLGEAQDVAVRVDDHRRTPPVGCGGRTCYQPPSARRS